MTEQTDIPIPAVSVVNGTKDSVVFVMIDSRYASPSRDEMKSIADNMKTQLIGTCMEGAKIIVTCGCQIEVAMPEDAAKLHNEGKS